MGVERQGVTWTHYYGTYEETSGTTHRKYTRASTIDRLRNMKEDDNKMITCSLNVPDFRSPYAQFDYNTVFIVNQIKYQTGLSAHGTRSRAVT